ncbi:pentatricopeptide repeat-containing protein At4g02750 [Andrographis paniculata]|uniref:pentatricopeptide repeat-containing protein At4g02750 n=1 Tax=Andrographis paniculata TaxID=175694 RepID=UPI0021E89FFF|nr:pentatricopeptide repeat-containing protein At4g02750 [Andrographis paniculata]XP_051115128.1 pentatricopeptide repeat-containing protein At4g02750 [Andrographis paniculata]XP_051115136.1 pentatricopeptide repeat-containing protein At4g02750 [Andrographis paniculata]
MRSPLRLLHSTTVTGILSSPTTRIRTYAPPPPRPPTTHRNGPPPTPTHNHLFTDSDIVKCNIAITNHMRNARCDSALRLFNSMPRRTSISYNAMISGYLANGRFQLAHQLFDEMPQKDLVSWNVMISGHIKNKDLGAARRLFDEMPVRDVVSWNAMLSGYAQNGFVDEARILFDEMPHKNEISWNGILAAYVQNGKLEQARRLFESKQQWTVVSWNCLMGGYLKKKRLVEARQIFDHMPVKDEVSWNTLISCYAQNGRMEEARKLFEDSPSRDVFTWTAMVSGYIQNGQLDEARRAFDEMPEKNVISWNAMISGYVQSKNIGLAGELFEAMPRRNTSSWNTMITGYAQNGDIVRARNLFDQMPHRDCISWAAIISGYSQSGDSLGAFQMFIEMKRDGERLNRSAFTCILSTCADVAAFELGKQIHGCVIKAGYEFGCYVGNALLAMYCRCGSIDEAYQVFDGVDDKDVVSWNTIIIGYARHGFGKEALRIFESMKRTCIQPDDVTMVGVLSACSHTGLVGRGQHYFESMSQDYGIVPNSKHYTCMIDLLGRAGRLDDAEKLMRRMPFEADAATWGALLGASRIHGDTALGEKAAERIFAMEPWNSGMYVLLSNLYAASGRWGDVNKMRLKMRNTGVDKARGYSWVEVENKIHTFSVGDSNHAEVGRIHAFLEGLDLRMRRDGYVAATKLVLHDVEEEEKQHMLKHHSEKLAVAYGMMKTPAGRPVRVFKNLRVCEDCHTAIKHMARMEGRLIILRDPNRFHHFQGGACNCGDYW